MDSWDEDYEWYQQDAAITELIEQSIKNISIDNARSYLGTYGDDVEARVTICLDQSQSLSRLGYYAAAVVAAATALELLIRFTLVRPLVQGAFLSDEWAAFLAGRIVNGRSFEDRHLLPAILRQWSIDLGTVHLSSGAVLWDTVIGRVWPKRNKIVHEGVSASAEDAMVSIECAESLWSQVVRVVAEKLGFTFEKTGKWSEIRGEKGTPDEDGYHTWGQHFSSSSPFDHA